MPFITEELAKPAAPRRINRRCAPPEFDPELIDERAEAHAIDSTNRGEGRNIRAEMNADATNSADPYCDD
jgi:hypothetical protein